MSGTIERGTALRNAPNGETFVFSEGIDNPDVGTFDVILEKGGSGGGNALAHIHPGADEHFRVKSGSIRVNVDGEERLVRAGESTVVPRGSAHYFKNASDGVTEISITFDPPQQHVRFFGNFALTTVKHPEWLSPRGDPDFLLIVLVLHTFSGHLYLAKIPMIVQRVLFALLAPVARWRGYYIEIAPKV